MNFATRFLRRLKVKVENERLDAFVKKFVAENPHLRPYFESGEAKGVYEKAALRIWDENPEISKVELMEKTGGIVADHFRKAVEAKTAAGARATGGGASA